MPDNLHQRLDRAAGPVTGAVDVDTVLRRGDQLRRRRTATWMATSGAAVVVVAIAIGAAATTARPVVASFPPSAQSGPTDDAVAPVSSPEPSASMTPEPATASATEGESAADDLDSLVAAGTVGQDLADQAAAEAFHPAMLVGPGQYAWYMNEPGFTDRVPEARVPALCAWAEQQDDLHEAYNAQVREHSEVLGSDGGPMVVEQVCVGERPRAWDDSAEDGNLNCDVLGEAKFHSQQAIDLCQQHEAHLTSPPQ